MSPYYEQDGVTIYHGDCREFLARDSSRRHDLLLTDPPYGIRQSRRESFNSPNAAPIGRYESSEWDDEPQYEGVATARATCRWQIIFGGNFYDLPKASCWLVWNKDNTGDRADCELAWTNLNKAVRMFRYRWNGMLQEPGCPREHRQHPTQKPEAVMRWAILQAPPDVRTVMDPFMGSGTTLVAAKRLGKTAVGIEINERYCEIAAERLQQGALDLFGEQTA